MYFSFVKCTNRLSWFRMIAHGFCGAGGSLLTDRMVKLEYRVGPDCQIRHSRVVEWTIFVRLRRERSCKSHSGVCT